jgi:hypothetical protein
VGIVTCRDGNGIGKQTLGFFQCVRALLCCGCSVAFKLVLAKPCSFLYLPSGTLLNCFLGYSNRDQLSGETAKYSLKQSNRMENCCQQLVLPLWLTLSRLACTPSPRPCNQRSPSRPWIIFFYTTLLLILFSFQQHWPALEAHQLQLPCLLCSTICRTPIQAVAATLQDVFQYTG